ncbi:hypothetical protein HK097_001437 [Rhizophlyctis rosea]|uniref:Uncharacterized protein n=1 Tax=Rhizophlyctis rosea TaxID=64517 RepID=A0AAD5X0S3_9FUNG|nr:hypothetical protein HK097_001437 [Rhizophlyctis rosea]
MDVSNEEMEGLFDLMKYELGNSGKNAIVFILKDRDWVPINTVIKYKKHRDQGTLVSARNNAYKALRESILTGSPHFKKDNPNNNRANPKGLPNARIGVVGSHLNQESGPSRPRLTPLEKSGTPRDVVARCCMRNGQREMNAQGVDAFFTCFPAIVVKLILIYDELDESCKQAVRELGLSPFYRLSANFATTSRIHPDHNDSYLSIVLFYGNWNPSKRYGSLCLADLRITHITRPGDICITATRFLHHWVTKWHRLTESHAAQTPVMGDLRCSNVISQTGQFAKDVGSGKGKLLKWEKPEQE